MAVEVIFSLLSVLLCHGFWIAFEQILVGPFGFSSVLKEPIVFDGNKNVSH